jgi:hypothetical protein
LSFCLKTFRDAGRCILLGHQRSAIGLTVAPMSGDKRARLFAAGELPRSPHHLSTSSLFKDASCLLGEDIVFLLVGGEIDT